MQWIFAFSCLPDILRGILWGLYNKIHKPDIFKEIDDKLFIYFSQQEGNAGGFRNVYCRQVNNIANAIIANLIDWKTVNNYAIY